jgi:tetratricopeptide (TPR) repeat protein
MSALIEALEAEARGDYAEAIARYETLAEAGSALDRIGVCQALARCLEKLGRLAEAAPWRRRAGRGYGNLDDEAMPRDEREYRALVEYRNAVQDAGEAAEDALVEEYLAVVSANLSAGAEGLTHEALFAGAYFRARGDGKAAMKFYFDAAEALSEEAYETGDDALREAAIKGYDIAAELATEAGRPDIAQVAFVRAKALRGPPPTGPQPLQGL